MYENSRIAAQWYLLSWPLLWKGLAESVFVKASLDEIEALQDPDLFAYEIEAEIDSRSLSSDRDRLKNDADYVASVVASKYEVCFHHQCTFTNL